MLTIRRGSNVRFMDCFFDAMLRTTGVDRLPTSPTRNQLTQSRTMDDHCPDEPAATTILAAAGNTEAKALHRHKARRRAEGVLRCYTTSKVLGPCRRLRRWHAGRGDRDARYGRGANNFFRGSSLEELSKYLVHKLASLGKMKVQRSR